ncbi:MAG: ABC transporter ATP-binding protein/permease, partial [archaeon]|nr:ABC transporter ATP-binding protein/permease [archaeon]
MSNVELTSKEKNNAQGDDPYQKVPLETQQENKGLDEEEEEDKILEGDADEEIKKQMMFEIQQISLFKIMSHLLGGKEVFVLCLGVIASLGAGLANPLVAYLTGDTFSEVGGDAESQEMSYAQMIVMMRKMEDTMMDQVYKYLWTGFGMFFAYLISCSCWTYVGLRLTYVLKERYFNVILRQEQGWFDANNAFEFATKVQAQLEQVEMGIGEQLGNIVQMIAMSIGGIVISFITSWKITLIVLCVSPFIVIDMMILVKTLKKLIVLGRKTFERAGGMAEECLYNIKTVASFSNFEFETERYGKVVDKVFGFDSEVSYRMGSCLGALIFFVYVGMACAFIYGRHLITNREWNHNNDREFKGGDVFTTISSTLMAVMSIGMISPMIKMVQESCIATSDYFTLLERKIKMDFSHSFYKPPRDKVKGKIEFKNVKFFYPSDPDERPILKGLNLLFEPGKKVALVGESGCGKSTTVNLIERLYETVSGQVLIDDIDIKEYDLHYLRTMIGYVQQEPILFNRTIEDNIVFGREELIKEMNIGDQKQLIKEACDEAFASEFVDNMPERYQSVVGIKGSKLSGGQKQR